MATRRAEQPKTRFCRGAVSSRKRKLANWQLAENGLLTAMLLVALVVGLILMGRTLAPPPTSNFQAVLPITVTRGDTLWSIANHLQDHGVSLPDKLALLYAANPGIGSGSLLKAGQTIYVPVPLEALNTVHLAQAGSEKSTDQ